MAKKRGYREKPLRSRRTVFMMNQVYDRSHEKLTFLRAIDIFGCWLLVLTPLAFAVLFFVTLLSGGNK